MTSDWFLVTADYAAYAAAQRESTRCGGDRRDWHGKTIRNTANMAWFSSDRTIADYARDIWNVPVGRMHESRRAGTDECGGPIAATRSAVS